MITLNRNHYYKMILGGLFQIEFLVIKIKCDPYWSNTAFVTFVVQSLSRVWLFATPWTAACQSSLYHLSELAQSRVRWVNDAIQPSDPLLSPSPPAFNLSQHQGFSSESFFRIRWPKYWSFSFSISPSNEYSGLISFRMDWFNLLVVQETLKNLLQHHSSKASILWRLAFFLVQLSHPYMTTGETIALTIWTFVGKVMSLLFNMLSKLVIAFLPRSKHLLISCTICSDFGAQENKVHHCFHCFPICLPRSDGTGCHDLSFLNVEL